MQRGIAVRSFFGRFEPLGFENGPLVILIRLLSWLLRVDAISLGLAAVSSSARIMIYFESSFLALPRR